MLVERRFWWVLRVALFRFGIDLVVMSIVDHWELSSMRMMVPQSQLPLSRLVGMGNELPVGPMLMIP